MALSVFVYIRSYGLPSATHAVSLCR